MALTRDVLGKDQGAQFVCRRANNTYDLKWDRVRDYLAEHHGIEPNHNLGSLRRAMCDGLDGAFGTEGGNWQSKLPHPPEAELIGPGKSSEFGPARAPSASH